MLCIQRFNCKRGKLIGQNKVKVCQPQSENYKFLGQNVDCPNKGTS